MATPKRSVRRAAKRSGGAQFIFAAVAVLCVLLLISGLGGGAQRIYVLPGGPWNSEGQLQGTLNVCLMAAEYWGLPGAGGTATAFEQLALALAHSDKLNVTFVGVTEKFDYAEQSIAAHAGQPRVHFEVVDKHVHFAPVALKVSRTHPHERLALAALLWLEQNQHRCDVVHVHEWGGVFTDLLTFRHFGGFRPGLAVVVQEHGGHFWSTQDEARPADVVSLRIDAREKLGVELADAVVAPTRYLFDWYAQRGWRVPNVSAIIPNAMGPMGNSAPTKAVSKQVWRIAFFGRLEERKGLKLFVAAVERLPSSVTSAPRFKVLLVGANSLVDEQISTTWLAARTANWTWPVQVLANVPRSQALQAIKQEGTMLALCSMVENAPFAVAEASAQSIPFFAFDVGGVAEMVVPKSSAILPFSSNHSAAAEVLRDALQAALQRGRLDTTPLRTPYRMAGVVWRDWHLNTPLRSRSEQRSLDVMNTEYCSRVSVYATSEKLPAQQLQDKVCQSGEDDDTILLLPEQYTFFKRGVAWAARCRLFEPHFDGGVTFGTWMPVSERASFAYSPTWIVYEGEREDGSMGDRCTTEIPIMLKRRTFCSTYHAYARNWEQYSSWSLALSLKQAGSDLLTFPDVMFQMKKWNQQGLSCLPDKLPAFQVSHQVASNMRGDPQYALLRSLAPSWNALGDLMTDLAAPRPHRWEFAVGESMKSLTPLQPWHLPGRSNSSIETFWACAGPTAKPFPHFSRYLLHPCVGTPDDQTACCDRPKAPAHVLYRSWFQLKDVLMLLSYEVMPACGDGLTVTVGHTPAGGTQTIELHRTVFSTSPTPMRKQLSLRLESVAAGDLLSLSAYPHGNHDCDGVYVASWQLWRAADAAELSLSAS